MKRVGGGPGSHFVYRLLLRLPSVLLVPPTIRTWSKAGFFQVLVRAQSGKQRAKKDLKHERLEEARSKASAVIAVLSLSTGIQPGIIFFFMESKEKPNKDCCCFCCCTLSRF